ncbi:hypothetical protein R3I93_019840 [Phoxinus phoxinus]|uniref:Myb/SANT-like DNA-binding domain-containing protein n=2 Tax=Phoxinus phoxinus TaxID=58324 RepID=A0AAN9CEN6_9TELE
MAILLHEVALHKDVLFSSFRTTVSNKTKKDVWERIAMKMAASSSSPQREWEVIRKKWHDFASAAKARGAAVQIDQARTGGGPSSVLALSPDEQKALAIIREAALQGISGGIDLKAGVDTTPCSQSRPSLPPRILTPSPPSSSDRASPGSASPRRSAPSSASTEVAQHQQSANDSRMCRSIRCDCSEELVKLEKEKLEVLRGIEQRLQEANNLARATLEVKKAKLQILEKQYALSEAKFQRPTISVPLMPGQDELSTTQ